VRTNPKNYVIAAVTVKLSPLEIYIYLLFNTFIQQGVQSMDKKKKTVIKAASIISKTSYIGKKWGQKKILPFFTYKRQKGFLSP
jgi:hypothetical protein